MGCNGCGGKATAPVDGFFGRPRRMPDGSLEFPRKGAEPPPDMEGYKRDPGNAWRFVRAWPDCKYRMDNVMLTECGSARIYAICLHAEAPNGQREEVSLQTCQGCKLRE